MGDVVYSKFFGHGIVVEFDDRVEAYPILVIFDENIQAYTATGAWAENPLHDPRNIRKLTKLERALQ